MPPTIGQHNDDVLATTGLSSQRIADLKAAGVVGSEHDRARAGGTAAWS